MITFEYDPKTAGIKCSFSIKDSTNFPVLQTEAFNGKEKDGKVICKQDKKNLEKLIKVLTRMYNGFE